MISSFAIWEKRNPLRLQSREGHTELENETICSQKVEMDSGFQLNEDTRSSMSCNEGDEQTEHDNETICSVHLNWFTDTELNHKVGAVKGVNDEALRLGSKAVIASERLAPFKTKPYVQGARVMQYAPQEGGTWYLQGSDNPGMQLVSVKLEGNNFNTWCRSVKIALGAKVKLGFIDGRNRAPPLESENYDEWKKTDCMVISWILNSISKELVEGFIYMDSAKQLWDVICERFGECNGPMIYELKRQIANYTQGNQVVMVYYNNLNKMWDELACLLPTATCTCADGRLIMERQQNDKLMQFLMGLNEVFDAVRSQILILDPLPTVNKAYSMVLRVEKQKQVVTHSSEAGEYNAMMTQTKANYAAKGFVGKDSPGGSRQQGYKPRLSKEEKARLRCEHCKGMGHEISECFKLHGYPDWFKKLKEQKRNEQANMADSPHPGALEVDEVRRGHFLSNPEMGSLITEIAKQMGTHPLTHGDTAGSANNAYFTGYAGPEE